MHERISELLEDGTVKKVSDTCMVVVVEGVELYVGTRMHHTGCDCCGDYSELTVSYNRLTEDRIENHGEADPLGIE